MKPLKVLAVAALAALLALPVPAEEKWQFSITPYIWGPWFDGTVGAGEAPPVETESSSLLDILDGAFLIQGEATKGLWTLIAEFNWVDLSDDIGPGILRPQSGWELEGFMASLAASYAVYDKRQTRLELLGGVRHWDVDVKTQVGGLSASVDQSITDAIAGFRFRTPITDRTGFQFMANYGSGDSEKQVETVAQVKWAWRENTDLALGYRYLSMDFKDSDALIDARLYGPFVSISFRF